MKNRLLLFALALVVTGATAEAASQAWVWADQPAAVSYSPNATFRYNPTGAPISITRSAVGVYQIRFVSLASFAGPGGNVQVTPFGGGTTDCRVFNWNVSGADVIVNVRCNTAAGGMADSMYTALFTYN